MAVLQRRAAADLRRIAAVTLGTASAPRAPVYTHADWSVQWGGVYRLTAINALRPVYFFSKKIV